MYYIYITKLPSVNNYSTSGPGKSNRTIATALCSDLIPSSGRYEATTFFNTISCSLQFDPVLSWLKWGARQDDASAASSDGLKHMNGRTAVTREMRDA